MLRTFTKFSKFMGNYSYYRKMGYSISQAWNLAGLTLPT